MKSKTADLTEKLLKRKYIDSANFFIKRSRLAIYRGHSESIITGLAATAFRLGWSDIGSSIQDQVNRITKGKEPELISLETLSCTTTQEQSSNTKKQEKKTT